MAQTVTKISSDRKLWRFGFGTGWDSATLEGAQDNRWGFGDS
jgi:hypothetical protein